MCYRLKQLLDTCNRTMFITNISARFLFLSFLYSSSPFLSCPCSSYSCLIYRSSSYRLLNKQIIHCLKKKKKRIKSNFTSLDSNSVYVYIIKTNTYSEFRFTRLLISQSY